MKTRIKIGDTVVYSPSLKPIVGHVIGIAGEHITARLLEGGNGRLECTMDECCPVTEEELKRLKEMMKNEQKAS